MVGLCNAFGKKDLINNRHSKWAIEIQELILESQGLAQLNTERMVK